MKIILKGKAMTELLTFEELNSINEALDLVPVNEPRLNKTKIIELLKNALEKDNAPKDLVNNMVIHFSSLEYLFGYNKKIGNANILVYTFKGKSGIELHFVDLYQIKKTGEETYSNRSSMDVFAYVISVLFQYINNNKAITIVAPPNNPKRLDFYLKISKYIIKKHKLELVPIISGNTLSFQHTTIKEGVNPFLIVDPVEAMK